jgi:hypothetical protein
MRPNEACPTLFGDFINKKRGDRVTTFVTLITNEPMEKRLFLQRILEEHVLLTIPYTA